MSAAALGCSSEPANNTAGVPLPTVLDEEFVRAPAPTTTVPPRVAPDVEIDGAAPTRPTLIVDFSRGEKPPEVSEGEFVVYLARYDGMEEWPEACLPVQRVWRASQEARDTEISEADFQRYLEEALPIDAYPSTRDELVEQSDECKELESARDRFFGDPAVVDGNLSPSEPTVPLQSDGG